MPGIRPAGSAQIRSIWLHDVPAGLVDDRLVPVHPAVSAHHAAAGNSEDRARQPLGNRERGGVSDDVAGAWVASRRFRSARALRSRRAEPRRWAVLRCQCGIDLVMGGGCRGRRWGGRAQGGLRRPPAWVPGHAAAGCAAATGPVWAARWRCGARGRAGGLAGPR